MNDRLSVYYLFVWIVEMWWNGWRVKGSVVAVFCCKFVSG